MQWKSKIITLRMLVEALRRVALIKAQTGQADDRKVIQITSDSREVGPGSVFVAVRGEQTDGHMFIDKAVKNGAIAVVCEAMPALRNAGMAHIQVENTRVALATLAATFYGHPSHELNLVGITGTNGKTTTAFLVHHLLEQLGQKAGLIGTIECRIGNEILNATLTTPDALTLSRLLRQMRNADCTACVMEVSSHALTQHRVDAQRFTVGTFTNLTHDHLDYHSTFTRYLTAKKRLFDGLGAGTIALYNADDAAGKAMVADAKAQVFSYGQAGTADFRVEILNNSMAGLQLCLDGQKGQFQLVGQFNAYNLLCAYGIGRVLGYEAKDVLNALETAPPVPGRFERLALKKDVTVIVDYAHTPDALENVLKTILDTKPATAQLWCIVGCGGDRDPVKRAIMGRIAEQYANHVIVTSDNPRTEDPQTILDDIRVGFHHPEKATWRINRREAIQYAAAHITAGDVVLISGKGHEPYQIIGTQKIHFDDREEARTYF